MKFNLLSILLSVVVLMGNMNMSLIQNVESEEVQEEMAVDNELTTEDGRFKYKITTEVVDGKADTYVTITGYLTEEEIVKIPDEIDGITVGFIGFQCDGDFSYDNLQQVILPERLISIGGNVFSDSPLTSIDLPSTLKEIRDGAFRGSSLESISFPESLEIIDSWAFQESNLSGEISIGKNLKEYSYDVFRDTGVSAVNVSDENQNGFFSVDGVVYHQDEDGDIVLLDYPEGKTDQEFVVPGDVTDIKSYAFVNSKLTNLVIHRNCRLDMWSITEAACPVSITLKHTSLKRGFQEYFSLWCIGKLPAGSEVVTKNSEVQDKILKQCHDMVVNVKNVPSEGFTVINTSDGKLSIDMAKSDKCQLLCIQMPATTTDNINWASSNETIAAVGKNTGLIVPMSIGNVTITGTDDSGHKQDIQVKITDSRKIDIGQATIKVAACRYTGNAITSNVTVKYKGKTLKIGKDYTLSFKNNINPGTATVTVQGKGNYSGKVTKNFTIKKGVQKISYVKTYNKAYGDKAFKIKTEHKAGDGRISYSSSDKSVAAINSKGKVSIKGTGRTIITIKSSSTSKYSGKTVKTILNVSPKRQQATVKKVKDKRLQVKWKKDTKANGYQVQYSTDKKFKKNLRMETIKKNQTNSRTFRNLNKGKIYYVRVRSYKTIKTEGKEKKLYGSWSTVVRSTVE